MKKHFSYLLAITFSIFLASCDKNEPSYSNYYTALGFIDTTAENSRGYIIDLDLDSDPNLVPVEIYDHHFDAEHGERVLVVFSLYNDNDINEDSADAVIHSITAVTYKDAVAYNDSIAEDLGKNAIYVEENSVWQNDNILNVIVGYWGSGYVRHTVNLVTPEELEVDTLGNYIIDLYHNNNGDAGSVYFEGIISFEIN